HIVVARAKPVAVYHVHVRGSRSGRLVSRRWRGHFGSRGGLVAAFRGSYYAAKNPDRGPVSELIGFVSPHRRKSKIREKVHDRRVGIKRIRHRLDSRVFHNSVYHSKQALFWIAPGTDGRPRCRPETVHRKEVEYIDQRFA